MSRVGWELRLPTARHLHCMSLCLETCVVCPIAIGLMAYFTAVLRACFAGMPDGYIKPTTETHVPVVESFDWVGYVGTTCCRGCWRRCPSSCGWCHWWLCSKSCSTSAILVPLSSTCSTSCPPTATSVLLVGWLLVCRWWIVCGWWWRRPLCCWL